MLDLDYACRHLQDPDWEKLSLVAAAAGGQLGVGLQLPQSLVDGFADLPGQLDVAAGLAVIIRELLHRLEAQDRWCRWRTEFCEDSMTNKFPHIPASRVCSVVHTCFAVLSLAHPLHNGSRSSTSGGSTADTARAVRLLRRVCARRLRTGRRWGAFRQGAR